MFLTRRGITYGGGNANGPFTFHYISFHNKMLNVSGNCPGPNRSCHRFFCTVYLTSRFELLRMSASPSTESLVRATVTDQMANFTTIFDEGHLDDIIDDGAEDKM